MDNQNVPIRIFNIKYSAEDRNRIHQLVDEVIDEAFLTNHTLCRRLEDLVNKKQNTNYSVSTTSATSGLETIFRTINIKNKAVLVQSNTFIATGHAIQAAGGIIVPFDLDENYVASFLDSIKAYDTCKANNLEVGAICIVNIGGRASKDIFNIKEFFQKQDIPVVEDNAQGFLSKINDHYLGAIGNFSVTSFQTTKVVACGEGGLITCDSESKLSNIRNNIFYGKSSSRPRIFDKISGNFKLSEMNAALAIADLERSEKRIKRRKEIDKIYRENINSKYCTYLNSPEGNSPSYYKTLFLAINAKVRIQIEEFFKRNQISMTGSVYREPLSMQPRIIESKDYYPRELPNTEKFCSLHFAPPNYPELSDNDIMRVVKVLNSFDP